MRRHFHGLNYNTTRPLSLIIGNFKKRVKPFCAAFIHIYYLFSRFADTGLLPKIASTWRRLAQPRKNPKKTRP